MKRLKLIDPKGGGGDRPAKRPRLDEPPPPPAPAPPPPSSSSSSSAGGAEPAPAPAAAGAGEGMTNEVVEFIRPLEDELEKFNSFFVEKEEEYIIKLKPPRLSTKEKMSPASEADNAEESKEGAPSLLGLPELALECILEKLPLKGLVSMSGVCKALRDRCRSDYFLDKHMKQKWDRVIGPSAYKVWRLCPASRRDNGDSNQGMQKGLLRLFSLVWPRSWAGEKINIGQDQTWSLPHDSSVMSRYIALETGSLWFPAQVYNRENGDARFMLSCYDAVLSYDFRTDAFTARYPPYGRKAIALETGVTWEKLRSPPVDTSPHDLHPSDCLKDLCPGDHVEIQWKRNKKLPYGWWYGVVGHLESCDRNENYCRCLSSDAVVLEFNQYSAGSWCSRTTIDRRNHGEKGNRADGFYGGIRKLRTDDEISVWRRLWPTELLEE